MPEQKARIWKTPEFFLVCVMLVVLVVLVLIVLWTPFTIPTGDTSATFVNLLDYRKDILSIIITAFGAWVGAGAAYFFGRENLREAATSLLAMREPSLKERLRRTPIREAGPEPLIWKVKTADKLRDVKKKLDEEPEYWFIPIIKEDGTLETVIEEEAVWHFVTSEIDKPENKDKKAVDVYSTAMDKTVQDLLGYIEGTEGLKRFKDGYVPVTLDQGTGDAYEQMQQKGVNLAVVLDAEKKPTQFITTADVRRVLLQMS